VGQNVGLHLPLLSAQLSDRASQAQICTGDAAQFFTCAGALRFEFGSMRQMVCAVKYFNSVRVESCVHLLRPMHVWYEQCVCLTPMCPHLGVNFEGRDWGGRGVPVGPQLPPQLPISTLFLDVCISKMPREKGKERDHHNH